MESMLWPLSGFSSFLAYPKFRPSLTGQIQASGLVEGRLMVGVRQISVLYYQNSYTLGKVYIGSCRTSTINSSMWFLPAACGSVPESDGAYRFLKRHVSYRNYWMAHAYRPFGLGVRSTPLRLKPDEGLPSHSAFRTVLVWNLFNNSTVLNPLVRCQRPNLRLFSQETW